MPIKNKRTEPMALLEIIIAPDPRLQIVCDPVETVDDELRRLMGAMLAAMYEVPGIGLSAPQVGKPIRVVVADVSAKEEESRPLRLVNPRIVETGADRVAHEEGCLSFPDQYSDVVRPSWARIAYLDAQGKPREIEAEGMLAVCLQHEIDHLDGILFVDHLTSLKRNMILRKMKKAKRLSESEPVA